MKVTNVFKVVSFGIMLLIFWFSDQNGEESLKQSNFILRYLKDLFEVVGLDVRKVAHFTIYMSLGVSLTLSREKKNMRTFTEVVAFVFLYACSDEFHQSLVPGRGPSFKDVIIDTCGGVTGALLARTKI
ncbi:VanZ family protein [Cetobacterium sp. 8H]|uniref:VanZ family protein n=1 Tax=Cetobacterium sp. 8H TaxID=2759681 RepID=UPI00163C24D6|nr:VanZ family protein [Cetobacterium sp. 8H]MBC2850900.1 VanZ family protein [Cetobacterium sp. 8H]